MSVLTDDQYTLLTFAEQFYALTTRLPTETEAVAKGHTKKVYKECVASVMFNKMLKQRHIRPYDFEAAEGNPSGLTSEELMIADTMLTIRDNRSQKNKLKDLKVSPLQYENLLRNPAFQNYLISRSESMLGDNLHEGHLSLISRVRSGDISAIKLLYEITGRYVPERSNRSIDIQSILVRVMESIQRHVLDTDTQAAIGADLISIAQESSGQFMGKALIRGELVASSTDTTDIIVEPSSKSSDIQRPSGVLDVLKTPPEEDYPVGTL